MVQYLGLIDIPNFIAFSGDINSFVQTTLMGIDGGIFAFANATPQDICHVHELVKKDKAQSAIKIHKAMMRLAKQSIGIYGLSGLKKLMEFCGYSPGVTRLPFMAVSESEASEIKQAYEDYKRVVSTQD